MGLSNFLHSKRAFLRNSEKHLLEAKSKLSKRDNYNNIKLKGLNLFCLRKVFFRNFIKFNNPIRKNDVTLPF